MFYLSIKLIFASIVAGLISLSFPQLASTQENSEISKLSQPPDTGTPEDTSSPGGSRTDRNRIGGCQDGEIPITSLIGNEMREFTVSKYPSFWFYVPCTNNEIDYLEFVLEETQTKRIIYRSSIQLSEVAGIIEVTLPYQSQYSLEPNKNYTWHLKGNYSSDSEDEPEIALSGWVRRIPLDSQLQDRLEASGSQQYDVYIQNEIMYNAITALAKQYQTKPGNPQIKNDWINLLKMLGIRQLANKPFVTSRPRPISSKETSEHFAVNSILFEPSAQHRDLTNH